jgi:hypothetical protein
MSGGGDGILSPKEKNFRINPSGIAGTASVKNFGFSSNRRLGTENNTNNTRLYSAENPHRYKLNNRRLKPNATGALGLPDIKGALSEEPHDMP